jgi:hypothetical protein
MQLINTIQRQVKPVIQALLKDTGLKESVTYKKYVSEAFDSTEGHNVKVTADTPLDGLVVAHTKESLKMLVSEGNMESKIQLGDKAYIFEFGDCPTGMSLKDQLLDSDSRLHGIQDITPVYKIVIIVTVKGSV